MTDILDMPVRRLLETEDIMLTTPDFNICFLSINPLPPSITSKGNFVRAMLNCSFPAIAA